MNTSRQRITDCMMQPNLPAFPKRCWKFAPILDAAGYERPRVRSRCHWVRWVLVRSVGAIWQHLAGTFPPRRQTGRRISYSVHMSDGNDGYHRPAKPCRWCNGCNRRTLLQTASDNPSRSKARRLCRKKNLTAIARASLESYLLYPFSCWFEEKFWS